MIYERPTWQADGACATSGDNMHHNFFDIDGNSIIARKLCADCRVRETRLDYALSTNQSAGIWGGLDANERLKAKRKKKVLQKRYIEDIISPHRKAKK